MQLRRGRGGKTAALPPSKYPVVGDSVKATTSTAAAVTGVEKGSAIADRIRRGRGRGDAAGKTASTGDKVNPQSSTRVRVTQQRTGKQ